MFSKKFFKVLPAVLLAVSFAVSADVSSAKEEYSWTFNQMALGKWCDNDLFKNWLPKKMSEETNGRLKLSVPINLLPVKQVFHAVRDGQIAGAVAGTPYYSGEWPIGSFHALPGILKENEDYPNVAGNVVWEYWEKSLRERYGIKLMGLNHWPGVFIYCNKPIRTVEDFKGLKLRGMGYYDTLAFEALGASSVSIPWDQAFTAVQRGVVDGLVTGILPYESMGFWKHCRYINDWPVHGASCAAMIIVNKEAFDELPGDLKPKVKRVLKDAGEKCMQCNNSKVDKSLSRLLNEKDCEFIKPKQEEIEKCLEKTRFVEKRWIEDCRESGDPEAEKMLKEVKAYLKKN